MKKAAEGHPKWLNRKREGSRDEDTKENEALKWRKLDVTRKGE